MGEVNSTGTKSKLLYSVPTAISPTLLLENVHIETIICAKKVFHFMDERMEHVEFVRKVLYCPTNAHGARAGLYMSICNTTFESWSI